MGDGPTVRQFGPPPRGTSSYWLAVAAAGALVLVVVAVGFAVWREEPPRPQDCSAQSHQAESNPTLIGLDTAENVTCGEAAQVVRRAEQALSEAGASFDTLDGVRVRTERGELCDVSFEYEFQWEITCRDGDAVVTGKITN